ncbi:hypothetical protein D3C87_1172540 [compost metagenome]
MSSVTWVSAFEKDFKRFHRQIEWFVVVRNKVPTNHVIDIAIAVIVDSVIWNFLRVSPKIWQQVFVRVVNARVDHSHDHVWVSASHFPGFRDANVQHAPLVREQRIRARCCCRSARDCWVVDFSKNRCFRISGHHFTESSSAKWIFDAVVF